MKKPSITGQVSSLNQTRGERSEKERSICNERKRVDFVWPTGKMKTLHCKQVTSTIQTNVHKVSTHTNKGLIQWNADVVYTRVRIIVNAATTLQRNNIRPVDYGQCNCYKEGCKF